MNFGCVGHIVGAGVNSHDITHAHTKVASDNLVHQDLLVIGFSVLCDESNAHSLLSLLACFTITKNG